MAFASWTSKSLLQLAVLLQPLQHPLPFMQLPERQSWQGTTIFPLPPADTEQQEHVVTAAAADAVAQEACSISAVVQAWHPTGFCHVI